MSAVPVAVPGTPAFAEIVTGLTFSCGLTGSGEVWCWGGIADFSVDPGPLSGTPPLATLTAGGTHACALDDTGRAWCWGDNGQGQLGNGTTDRTGDAVQAASGRRFVGLSGTLDGTCGLEAVGDVWCWGAGRFGELGNGSYGDTADPVRVDSPIAFAALSRSSGTGSHQCGIDAAGGAHCWGWNYGGQLGDGSLVKTPVPVPVAF